MILKKIYFIPLALCLSTGAYAACGTKQCPPTAANAKDRQFVQEINDGLVITNVTYGQKDYQGGQLASDVYSMESNLTQEQCCANSNLYCCKKKQESAKAETEKSKYDLFIPTNMYIRAGASYTLPFISTDAEYGPAGFTASPADTWGMQFSLGWYFSPHFRAEADVKIRELRFSDADWSAYELKGKTQGVGATVYFDFVPRYERQGDLTKRNRFVPYVGFGISGGAIDFMDAGVQPIGFGMGEHTGYIAPRGVLGVSLALSQLVNLDIEYQVEAPYSNGYGWQTDAGFTVISDVIASLRFNF